MAAVASARQDPHLSSAMDMRPDDKSLRPPSVQPVKTSPQQRAKTIEESSSTSATTAATTATTATTSGTSKSGTAATSGLNPDNGPPPPPPPATETPGGDYFSFRQFAEEPNPFEQSFQLGSTPGGGDPLATPGKAILPPVTAITSPAPLLPGSGGSGFNWGPNSLRSGPLSPAMLQGPAVSTSITSSGPLGFDSHIRTGLTPNESGIRSGLTPGGSGSMFPLQSPASQLFQQFVAPGVSTPGTMEFKKTALSAAAKKSAVSGEPTKIELPDINMTEAPAARRFSVLDGMHDPAQNAAANGLFMLAQGSQQTQNLDRGIATSAPMLPPQSLAPSSLMTETSGLGGSRPAPTTQSGVAPSVMSPDMGREGSNDFSDSNSDNGNNNASARGGRGGRRGGSNAGSRRKASETNASANTRSKKTKVDANGSGGSDDGNYEEQQSPTSTNGTTDKEKNKKMTDEEKRKNFLERNRVAALKCRQRKKQWLASLQKKVELYTSENDALNAQVTSLREELVALKTLLIAHKDCPGIPLNIESIGNLSSIPVDYMSHSAAAAAAYHMQPGMQAQMQQPPNTLPGVMAPPPGAGGPRRFS